MIANTLAGFFSPSSRRSAIPRDETDAGRREPFLSLAATYTLGAAAFLACYALAPDAPPPGEAKTLNWTVFALALSVVGLDIGFLMLYRRDST